MKLIVNAGDLYCGLIRVVAVISDFYFIPPRVCVETLYLSRSASLISQDQLKKSLLKETSKVQNQLECVQCDVFLLNLAKCLCAALYTMLKRKTWVAVAQDWFVKAGMSADQA